MCVQTKWVQVAGIALGMMASAGALAQDLGLELAKSKACMACHQVDTKRVGPPLSSVAQRYGGNGSEITAYLAGKIRRGGRGAWGAVPMPAQSQVTEDEARELAQWILTLNPAN